MAWGRPQGIDDLVKRLASNDPNLKSLTLLRQRKLDGAEDVKKLCTALQHNTHLTELSLSAHVISAAAAQHLSDLLASNTVLQSISIGNSQFGDAGMVALAPGVAASRSLTTLDAEHKGVGSEGAAALGAALHSCQQLTTLQLGQNPLGDAGLTQLVSHGWASSLRHLDLHDCGVGAAGLASLASCPSLSSLHSLSLARNASLTCDAATALQQLLKGASSLRKLQLQHTSIEDGGVAGLAAGILEGGGNHLVELDLACTAITDEAGQELSRALASSSCSMQHLSLEGNTAITDITATALASAIYSRHKETAAPTDTLLTHLNLSTTGISPAALTELARIPSLRHLAMLGCNLAGEGSPILAQLLSRSGVTASDGDCSFPALTELVTSGCGMDGSELDTLLQALLTGAAPRLVSWELGGNPGCGDESFVEKVGKLRDARPDLQLHWRSGDQPMPVQH